MRSRRPCSAYRAEANAILRDRERKPCQAQRLLIWIVALRIAERRAIYSTTAPGIKTLARSEACTWPRSARSSRFRGSATMPAGPRGLGPPQGRDCREPFEGCASHPGSPVTDGCLTALRGALEAGAAGHRGRLIPRPAACGGFSLLRRVLGALSRNPRAPGLRVGSWPEPPAPPLAVASRIQMVNAAR